VMTCQCCMASHPGVVMSEGAAESLEFASQNVLTLPQGNKKSVSKLLAQKVRCWQELLL